MCAKKKYPLIVREPVFSICVNLKKYVITTSLEDAVSFFEQGNDVLMIAELLNEFGLIPSEHDGIVKSSVIIAMKYIPNSNCWYVRTDDEVYHIVNW